ncbi:MAG: hypothetical protein LBB75_04645 [Oscillospiraceae bacterium]|jgi:hypothetical protein|nr:hypothetical protein [Oscillospiraceae bacterium]
MAKTREKKEKQPKIKKEKAPGRGKTALAAIAFVLALIALSGGVFIGYRDWRAAQQAAKDKAAFDQRMSALEDAAASEKNRESVAVQMEPHALMAAMADSAFLYKTRFSSVRYEANPQASALVKLRVPVTVTIFNTGDQTVTVTGAALYPWETIFEEGFRQEALAARQEKGFFGELAQGQRDGFSIAPGESQALEVYAMLRGVYGHPALEAELQRFLTDCFADPENVAPDPGEDVTIEGRGVMNSRVNTLFGEALRFYCAQRGTRFTLTYVIRTGRGNSFSATCVVPL